MLSYKSKNILDKICHSLDSSHFPEEIFRKFIELKKFKNERKKFYGAFVELRKQMKDIDTDNENEVKNFNTSLLLSIKLTCPNFFNLLKTENSHNINDLILLYECIVNEINIDADLRNLFLY